MSAEDVRTLEEAADVLMRLHATQTAVKLYALALKVRAEQGDWPLAVIDAAKAREALDEEWLS